VALNPPTNKERIQNALLARAWAAEFQPVVTALVGSARTITVGETPPRGILPASVRAEETFSRFGRPRRNRRRAPGFMRERTGWNWKLALNFNEEVVTETFEAELQDNPIYLPATADLRQVILELQFANPQHPAQQDPSNGTKITFTFNAQEAPL
jgi:hypothetical protein